MTLWLDGPWSVPCPYCFAKVDEPCYAKALSKRRKTGADAYHADRVAAWGMARDRSRAIRAEVAKVGNKL